MSELLREAFREYERKRQWDEINAYGRWRADQLGIAESDVPRLVREWREEHKGKKPRRTVR